MPHFIFQQHPRFLRQPKVQSLVPQDAFFHANLLELNNRSLLVFGLPFLNPSKQMICIIPCLCTADIGFPRQKFISCSVSLLNLQMGKFEFSDPQNFCGSWPVRNTFFLCNLFLQLPLVCMQVPFLFSPTIPYLARSLQPVISRPIDLRRQRKVSNMPIVYLYYALNLNNIVFPVHRTYVDHV